MRPTNGAYLRGWTPRAHPIGTPVACADATPKSPIPDTGCSLTGHSAMSR